MRQVQPKHSFKFETDWQQFVKLETSLNRILQNPQNFCLTHDNFLQILDQIRSLKSIVQVIKMQRKSYSALQESNRSIQAKLANHNSIISSIEQSYSDRIRALTEEIRVVREQAEKQRKQAQDKHEAVEKEVLELKEQLKNVEEKLEHANKIFKDLENRNQELKAELSERELLLERVLKSKDDKEMPLPKSSRLEEILSSRLNKSIIEFLAPKDLANVLCLSRLTRICLLSSPKCISAMLYSVAKTGTARLKIYKKHIKHFEASCENIPEQMVQTAFYKYMILKKKAGQFMLPVLNSSALLFQGKFVEVNIEWDEDLQQRAENDLIQVDAEIKAQFVEQTRQNREMIAEQVVTMYKKIHNTAQLYSADVESIGLFLNNLEKNYSKLFVAGKLLASEIKSLQILNTYLLAMVSERQSVQVAKNSEIQDLKAQLESQARIKNFFSAKSMHAQQRALTLQNEKLNQQLKLRDFSQKYGQIQKNLLISKAHIEELEKKNQTYVRDNKALKQNFDTVSGKYKTVMQQLQLLQDTLIQMKIS